MSGVKHTNNSEWFKNMKLLNTVIFQRIPQRQIKNTFIFNTYSVKVIFYLGFAQKDGNDEYQYSRLTQKIVVQFFTLSAMGGGGKDWVKFGVLLVY